MKKWLTVLAAAALLAGVAGCNTFDGRAREKAAVFNALDTATRERLREGGIQVGDTTDMVYIALGSPDSSQRTARTGGEEEVWIYKRFYQVFAGYHTYYERYHTYDPKTKTYRVHIVPVSAPVWETRTEAYLRVGFANGRVDFVEEGKRG
ncbi:MAG: hypothetical protein LBR12_00390 [Opitutaceae bacterium]|jgi:hypothetical protein|nr:hypothetical protein [Opitutaceae bacterium]